MSRGQNGINATVLRQFLGKKVPSDARLTLSQDKDGALLVLQEWSAEERAAFTEEMDMGLVITSQVRELAEVEGEAVKAWLRFVSPSDRVYAGLPLRAVPSEERASPETEGRLNARLTDALLRQNGQMVQIVQAVSQIAIGLARSSQEREQQAEQRHARELDSAIANAVAQTTGGSPVTPEQAAARAELTKSFAGALGPVMEGIGGAIADAIEKNLTPPSH